MNRPSREVDFDAGVSIGAGKQVSFFLGQDTRTVPASSSLLPQALVNGLKFSLLYAMAAIGLSLIYGTTGLSNFSHGEMVTLGAIVAWYMNVEGLRLHLFLAPIVGIAATALFGGAVERGVWRPLRRRGMSLTSMMILSIGIAIAVRYVFLFWFGGRNRRFRQYVGESQKEMHFWKVGITPRPDDHDPVDHCRGRCVPVPVAVPLRQGHPPVPTTPTWCWRRASTRTRSSSSSGCS